MTKNMDFHITNFLLIWNCITLFYVCISISNMEFRITKILKLIFFFLVLISLISFLILNITGNKKYSENSNCHVMKQHFLCT